MRKLRCLSVIAAIIVAAAISAAATAATAVTASAAAAEPSDWETAEQSALAALQHGDYGRAALGWRTAATAHEAAGRSSATATALLRLSEAYSALGEHRSALEAAERALQVAQTAGNPCMQPRALAGVGVAAERAGAFDHAEHSLQAALEAARQTDDLPLQATVQHALGTLYAARGRHSEALAADRTAIALAQRADLPMLEVNAGADAGVAALQDGDPSDAQVLLAAALSRACGPATSREQAEALVRLGRAYERLHGQRDTVELLLSAADLYRRAAVAADAVGDPRLSSYAYGYLAQIDEAQQHYAEALTLTRRAVFAAQQVDAPEILYQWEWQTCRLLRARADQDGALSACRSAVQTLYPIRQAVAVQSSAAGPEFRDSVAAIFLGLVDLLLRHAASTTDAATQEAFLLEARTTMESLKLAELQNYFRDECVDPQRSRSSRLEDISPTTAVIYPILLPDRIELLVSGSTGIRRFATAVGSDRVTAEVGVLRRLLEKRTTYEFLRSSQQLYDWLIAPIEPELTRRHVDTLVFVPSGVLGTIPMAALHDGKQFLIARYAIAITPGLDLTDPRRLTRDRITALIAALTQPVQGFPALASVDREVHSLQALFGGTLLLDQDFQIARVQREMQRQPFTLVHVASHGEFQHDVATTFLLTFDGKITMDRLDELVGLFRYRDEPLELLTLSACQTAAGDDRAALGLAGVAVRAGARSALASLWYVDDEASAAVITEFYRQLPQPDVTKAVALQRAQLMLLRDRRYRHPGYWSPYLLINNWL